MTSTEMIVEQNENQLATQSSDGEWWKSIEQFELIQRVAAMFSQSELVPKIYQGKNGIGSCVIAFNMAARMKADPLMVMQNLYIVHGKPAWSAQFMIACFNQTGRFSPIRYTFTGQENTDNWSCSAWAIDKETGEEIRGTTITIKMAKDEGWYQKKGSKWQTMPEQMMRYRSATFLVRAYAPELTMGLQTVEENHDVYTPSNNRSEIVNAIESLEIEEPDVPPTVEDIQDNAPSEDDLRRAAEAMT